ncbi:RimJ/RimL family protein N-acetyltransferase [Planomicrobium soli]|uniref:RimJ/RimL family protein N-acetyltransferase n=1 Tax=Planomicrobium soli TaxID=1176648 RepID=A0A2P8H1S1_9BACL|nr:GNAT family protein [Planomicrobium soli]PSL40161.1 RimJ/RimL family protein N-acetyltransferase [Planomicrobium soli]
MENHLESTRLYLRELAEDDWQAVHEYASLEIVSRYQPWGPNSEEESRAFVDTVLLDASKEPRSRFVFAIVLSESEKLIGAGEFNVQSIANRVGEIGYIVNPAYWGQGIATETARRLVEFGFSELGLHRIYATCDPRNIASQKILEKIGMVKEGLMREDLLMKDGWRDSLLYSVLEQEWREMEKGFADPIALIKCGKND